MKAPTVELVVLEGFRNMTPVWYLSVTLYGSLVDFGSSKVNEKEIGQERKLITFYLIRILARVAPPRVRPCMLVLVAPAFNLELHCFETDLPFVDDRGHLCL